MKILIIRFSSIGDIVLTTPVIRCLRKKFPDDEIHYLVKQSYSSIIEANPYVNKVHILYHNLDEVITELKEEKFDHIIDLQHNLRTFKIKKALKNVASSSFHKLNIEKWVCVNFKINIMPHKHIVDRYMETVNHLGVKNDGMGLDYFIRENERVKHDDLPVSHLHGYIGLVVGAAYHTKKLPIDKLKELCSKIDYPIILLGGKHDYSKAIEIASIDPVKVYNACGKFHLNESADIIRNAKLVITHDTGLMHIAAAFKKYTISVWGNTVPSFGMYPYHTLYDTFQVNKLWCRPCSKLGYQKCPLGHFKCMRKIYIDDMVSRVNVFLKK